MVDSPITLNKSAATMPLTETTFTMLPELTGEFERICGKNPNVNTTIIKRYYDEMISILNKKGPIVHNAESTKSRNMVLSLLLSYLKSIKGSKDGQELEKIVGDSIGKSISIDDIMSLLRTLRLFLNENNRLINKLLGERRKVEYLPSFEKLESKLRITFHKPIMKGGGEESGGEEQEGERCMICWNHYPSNRMVAFHPEEDSTDRQHSLCRNCTMTYLRGQYVGIANQALAGDETTLEQFRHCPYCQQPLASEYYRQRDIALRNGLPAPPHPVLEGQEISIVTCIENTEESWRNMRNTIRGFSLGLILFLIFMYIMLFHPVEGTLLLIVYILIFIYLTIIDPDPD